ncbi:hypothetical protein E4T43_09166 [Aureobasidium subglaciale]|nr:hypothetical protein E4T43_09166 [Aureobasidium subglaciale]
MVVGLKFCAELLDKYHDLYQAGKADFVEPFLNKVSNDDAPDYETLVPRPMWLARMAYRLTKNRYTSVEEFVADFKLMILNCRKYNKEPRFTGHENGRFLRSADQFENDFLSECSKKNMLIAPFIKDDDDNDDNDDNPSKSRTTRSSARQAGTPDQGTIMAGGRLSALRRTTGAKRPRTQTERGTLGEPSTKRARKSGPVDNEVEEEEEEGEGEAQITAPPKRKSMSLSIRLTVPSSEANNAPTTQPTLSDAVVASEDVRQDAEENVVNEQSTERAHTDDSPKHDEDDVEDEEDENDEVQFADRIRHLVGDLRNTMKGKFQEFARHQYQLMLRIEATRDVYDKVWRRPHLVESREIWKKKCRARIINEARPGSEVSIRATMKQTWIETSKEQLMAILQKEAESKANRLDNHAVQTEIGLQIPPLDQTRYLTPVREAKDRLNKMLLRMSQKATAEAN